MLLITSRELPLWKKLQGSQGCVTQTLKLMNNRECFSNMKASTFPGLTLPKHLTYSHFHLCYL